MNHLVHHRDILEKHGDPVRQGDVEVVDRNRYRIVVDRIAVDCAVGVVLEN